MILAKFKFKVEPALDCAFAVAWFPLRKAFVHFLDRIFIVAY